MHQNSSLTRVLNSDCRRAQIYLFTIPLRGWQLSRINFARPSSRSRKGTTFFRVNICPELPLFANPVTTFFPARLNKWWARPLALLVLSTVFFLFFFAFPFFRPNGRRASVRGNNRVLGHSWSRCLYSRKPWHFYACVETYQKRGG